MRARSRGEAVRLVGTAFRLPFLSDEYWRGTGAFACVTVEVAAAASESQALAPAGRRLHREEESHYLVSRLECSTRAREWSREVVLSAGRAERYGATTMLRELPDAAPGRFTDLLRPLRER